MENQPHQIFFHHPPLLELNPAGCLGHRGQRFTTYSLADIAAEVSGNLPGPRSQVAGFSLLSDRLSGGKLVAGSGNGSAAFFTVSGTAVGSGVETWDASSYPSSLLVSSVVPRICRAGFPLL